MKALNYKGYAARIEFDAEDEIFTGRIAGIRDIIGFHADNVADLKDAFREAVDDYLELCIKVGKDPQKPYSGNLMLRVGADVHSKAALAAELSGMSLNQWGEEVLSAAAQKIVAG
jgi:predicted HicB family RNase H-like nuclease